MKHFSLVLLFEMWTGASTQYSKKKKVAQQFFFIFITMRYIYLNKLYCVHHKCSSESQCPCHLAYPLVPQKCAGGTSQTCSWVLGHTGHLSCSTGPPHGEENTGQSDGHRRSFDHRRGHGHTHPEKQSKSLETVIMMTHTHKQIIAFTSGITYTLLKQILK